MILACHSSKYSSVEIKVELQKNILKFGYGINYKYEGMLAHSFDRFYVVTKFILPTLDDLKLSPIRYNKECSYIQQIDDQDNDHIKENIKELLFCCAKLRPFMAFYKMQIKAHNTIAHCILKNEVDLTLPKFYTECRDKRGIFGAIISGFIGLGFEGISSFLHYKMHNALQRAVKTVSISMDAQRNKLMHLENSLIMYRVYNAKTLEKLVKTAHILHSQQSLIENLFTGQTAAAYEIYSQMHNAHGIQHYAISSLLYLCTIKDKYIAIYNEFISQLQIYAKAVRILAKGYLGYLPILLVTPLILQQIISAVKDSLIKTNPDTI